MVRGPVHRLLARYDTVWLDAMSSQIRGEGISFLFLLVASCLQVGRTITCANACQKLTRHLDMVWIPFGLLKSITSIIGVNSTETSGVRVGNGSTFSCLGRSAYPGKQANAAEHAGASEACED